MRTQKKVKTETSDSEPHRVRLPGFIVEREVGLGDAITRIAYTAGLRPCDGCQRRAAMLNRWVILSR
jgi:hypothetical protein